MGTGTCGACRTSGEDRPRRRPPGTDPRPPRRPPTSARSRSGCREGCPSSYVDRPNLVPKRPRAVEMMRISMTTGRGRWSWYRFRRPCRTPRPPASTPSIRFGRRGLPLLRVDRPAELILVHRGTALDAEVLRFVVELLPRPALGPAV